MPLAEGEVIAGYTILRSLGHGGMGTTNAAPALPVVVVGADCATMGAAGVTTTGAPAFCAKLTDTNETIWSKYQGEFDSASVPAGTNPDEANVRVCMEQTNQSQADCDAAINRHNATNS